MTTVTTPLAPFDELATAIAGRVLRPTDADYPPLATPWNVAVASAPAAVVAAAAAADVVAAVRFADRHDLEVAVQATGHGAVALASGADGPHRPTRRTDRSIPRPAPPGSEPACAGSGARRRRPVRPRALAGSSPGVGVVGSSPVAACPGGPHLRLRPDYVTAFEVVTGDGELRRVTADRERGALLGAARRQGRARHRHRGRVRPGPGAELFGGACTSTAPTPRAVPTPGASGRAPCPSRRPPRGVPAPTALPMCRRRWPAADRRRPLRLGRRPGRGRAVIAPLRAVAAVTWADSTSCLRGGGRDPRRPGRPDAGARAPS